MSQGLELANWSYLAMLLFTLIGSWWLEFAFKIKVLRRPRILLLSILPVSAFFLIWDAFAIYQKHWTFDQDQILGYFIAQPLLFFEGQTQNLWVEHVRAENKEIHFYYIITW